MTVKDLIRWVKSNDDLIRKKEEELKRLESRCGLQGVSYEEKIRTSPNPNRLEELYLSVLEFKEDLEQLKQSAINERIYLDKLISRIKDETTRSVMYDYVLGNLSPKQLAIKYNYAKGYIYSLIRKGTELLERYHKISL